MHVLGSVGPTDCDACEPCSAGSAGHRPTAPQCRPRGPGNIDDQQTRAVQPTLIQIIEERRACGGAFPRHNSMMEKQYLLLSNRGARRWQPATEMLVAFLSETRSLMTVTGRGSARMMSSSARLRAHQASPIHLHIAPSPAYTSLLTAPLELAQTAQRFTRRGVRAAKVTDANQRLCRLGTRCSAAKPFDRHSLDLARRVLNPGREAPDLSRPQNVPMIWRQRRLPVAITFHLRPFGHSANGQEKPQPLR